jgi:hypothetical protein
MFVRSATGESRIFLGYNVRTDFRPGSLRAYDRSLRSTCPPPATWGFQMDSGQRGSTPALQNILEKSVRELGAIRLIDSRVAIPGQLACNPWVIFGCFRTSIGFAWLHSLVLFVILQLHFIH